MAAATITPAPLARMWETSSLTETPPESLLPLVVHLKFLLAEMGGLAQTGLLAKILSNSGGSHAANADDNLHCAFAEGWAD